MNIYRHGDVLLAQVDILPQSAKRQKGRVLAEGEATGHAHRLEGKGTLYLADGELYLRADEGAAVVHEEHARIPLAPGVYRIIGQREYRPAAAPVRVVD